jgi:hypothetical protein
MKRSVEDLTMRQRQKPSGPLHCESEQTYRVKDSQVVVHTHQKTNNRQVIAGISCLPGFFGGRVALVIIFILHLRKRLSSLLVDDLRVRGAQCIAKPLERRLRRPGIEPF